MNIQGKGEGVGVIALWAHRSFNYSAAKAERPKRLGRCEYIHCMDKEIIKLSIFGNQFAYVNTET